MNRTSSDRRTRRFRQPNGFTLMELLIVMAIITVLMLLAIPNGMKLYKHVQELSAKKSLQTIQQAQSMYAGDYPNIGFACNILYLGGDPAAGPPSATSAQMIPQELANGVKSGYKFTIGQCTKATGSERVTSYTVTAVPETVGRSGDFGFCLDQYGTIKSDPAGGTNCTQLVQ
ncbi:MAG TPA: prepilin-type N-terminal cleavage/methylation domain-containing protein [Terracidiphilus sp.]|jgi:type IV pilus assembly protein PilA